ncbi:MAG: hypothetical protein JSV44_10570 [Candidatus Zixiibacteriota bacterium]|nr:MAG: hypothetical protein JSV44_10570 [candidate division Zixibacteria bacterium]
MRISLTVLVCFLLQFFPPIAAAEKGDSFDRLQKEFSGAKLVSLVVLIEIKSSIFGEVDSTHGSIAIADDGRYRAQFNDDLYFFDGRCIWEYSEENNQATKDCLEEGETFENELVFLKNPGRYYQTRAVIIDSVYNLVRTGDGEGSLPDSLVLVFDRTRTSLSLIKYYDLNNDLNMVSILSHEISDSIRSGLFEVTFADSVEIINMP